MADQPQDQQKSLEMRVAELEDRLAKIHITEDEIKAYQKVAGLLGSASAPPVQAAQCVVDCINSCISECAIRNCTIIRNCTVIRNCTIIRQCTAECIQFGAGGFQGGGYMGGGFGSLGG